MTDGPEPRAFGRPLAQRRPPLCPEITLGLLDGGIDLEAACRDLDACHPPPYWAFCWGAGQALARFLLDRPDAVRGRCVVDFGSGCGVVAIAAALCGAARVTAVDTDPVARAAARRNAARNGVLIHTASEAPCCADVVLAADVLYEAGCLDWLTERRRAGSEVLVADPERAASPRLPGPALARYAVHTLPDVDSPSGAAAVFRL
jgi:predicted nicotinamide N-methyase